MHTHTHTHIHTYIAVQRLIGLEEALKSQALRRGKDAGIINQVLKEFIETYGQLLRPAFVQVCMYMHIYACMCAYMLHQVL
jgi:hypothetical protein